MNEYKMLRYALYICSVNTACQTALYTLKLEKLPLDTTHTDIRNIIVNDVLPSVYICVGHKQEKFYYCTGIFICILFVGYGEVMIVLSILRVVVCCTLDMTQVGGLELWYL